MSKFRIPINSTAILLSAFAVFIVFGEFVSLKSEAIEATVPFAPNPVTINGQTTIVYEIHVTNKISRSIVIDEVIIKNEKGSIIKDLNADEIKKSFQSTSDNSLSTSLGVHEQGVIYITVPIDKKSLPDFIDHTIVSGDSASQKIFHDHIRAKVNHNTAVVLGPPLQSGNWAAIYSGEWPRGHRRVIYTKNGIDRIPGRFAIDFMKLDGDGHYAKGDENVITNWYGYGTDILAVADGIVSSTRDDFKESKTIADHPDYLADMATGNYISIKIDEHHYVFYEHLKPQSILVKKGQSVKMGQVIAKIGFTGQTTGPHLHLHIANTDSPLGAEGVPFVFNKFKLIGTYPDFSEFGKSRWTDNNKGVAREYPPANSIITF